MRHRRRNRHQTDQQKSLERYADRAQFRLDILTCGLAEVLRRRSIDDAYDLELVQSIVDNDIEPAVKLAERTQADLDESYRKRTQPRPGRTVKTKRKDPKSTKAKK